MPLQFFRSLAENAFQRRWIFCRPDFWYEVRKESKSEKCDGEPVVGFFGFVVVVVVVLVVVVVGRHLPCEGSAQLKGWSGFSFSE